VVDRHRIYCIILRSIIVYDVCDACDVCDVCDVYVAQLSLGGGVWTTTARGRASCSA
jgi:hypothetical protein